MGKPYDALFQTYCKLMLVIITDTGTQKALHYPYGQCLCTSKKMRSNIRLNTDYVQWFKKKALDLSKYPEEPTEPINRMENTEYDYMKRMQLKVKKDEGDSE